MAIKKMLISPEQGKQLLEDYREEQRRSSPTGKQGEQFIATPCFPGPRSQDAIRKKENT
ncbi:MAG: hypothetical protein M1324_02975 [Patescibacteria group bacterium]|nr:hypothetical protein [Patescibacteria group bacterium]